MVNGLSLEAEGGGSTTNSEVFGQEMSATQNEKQPVAAKSIWETLRVVV